jgi:hypothetical protein
VHVCARVFVHVCASTGQKEKGTSQRPPATSIVSLNSNKCPPAPSLSFSFSFSSSSSSSASLQGRDSRSGDSRSWFGAPLGRLPRIPSEHCGAHAAAACAPQCFLARRPELIHAQVSCGSGRVKCALEGLGSQLPLEFVGVLIARVSRRRAALLVCLGSGHRRVPWFFSGSAPLRWGGSEQTDSETIDNRSVLWWRIPTGALMVPSGLSSLMLLR